MSLSESLCAHYPRCGGCQIQHIPYIQQIRTKERYLKKVFHRNIKIASAPAQFRYRGRMDFITTFCKTGLHKKGSFRRIVDIEHCPLLSEKANGVFQQVKHLCKDYAIPDYDINRKCGFLKHVVLRETQAGAIMVIFISAQADESVESEFKKLMEHIITSTGAVSCWWLLSESLTDRTQAVRYHFTGEPDIIETIGNIRFAIGPETFFQNNISVAWMCYDMIRSHLKEKENVLDAYCGCGVIGLYVHDRSSKIVGVDRNTQSIESARRNAEMNKISNVEFIEHDAASFIRQTGYSFDTVILDPPRQGLMSSATKAITEVPPKKIIYMSCNPQTQFRDIRRLTKHRLIEIKGFDMFPQTKHIETVAVLERIE